MSMEQHIIASNPELISVIVLGVQRLQTTLLLEPADLETDTIVLNTIKYAMLIERV